MKKKDSIEKRADILPSKAELLRLADELARKANATNTRIAYSGDWARFTEWCRAMQESPLPASVETVRAYMAYLYEQQKKPATIRRAISSIRQAHKLIGLKNPFQDVAVKTEQGIRRTAGIAQKQAAPITIEHLRRIIGGIILDMLGKRDRALLLVGWSAALRRSELVALDVEDLEECAEGFILKIQRSKTDQEKKGYKVGLPFVEDKTLCPVRALRDWLGISSIKEGAIFRGLGMRAKNKIYEVTKNRLTAQTVNIIVKRRAAAVDYDPDLFSGHSLRAGFVTAASKADCRPDIIRQITGHRTSKTLELYIRDTHLFEDHPLFRMLGKSDEK